MDILKDYTNQTIKLKPDFEGEVTATLVSSKFNTGNRKSVLYLHGYVDYFFQSHLGEKFIENNFDLRSRFLEIWPNYVIPPATHYLKRDYRTLLTNFNITSSHIRKEKNSYQCFVVYKLGINT